MAEPRTRWMSAELLVEAAGLPKQLLRPNVIVYKPQLLRPNVIVYKPRSLGLATFKLPPDGFALARCIDGQYEQAALERYEAELADWAAHSVAPKCEVNDG